MRIIHYWRYLSVVSWLALAAVGVWAVFTLSGMGEFRTDGTPRTVLDKAVPYLFFLLVPLGLWKARKEFLDARAETSLAHAEAEKQRQRRQRQKAAQTELANRPPLADAIKQEALATLDLLKTAGVIGRAEIEEAAFLDLCNDNYIESGDLHEVSGILALYAEAHGDFDNMLFVPDQVEVATPDIVGMIEGFARLAGRSADLADITVTFSNDHKRGADGEARFTLAGAAQTLAFEYHNKNASGSLMEGLATMFDPTPLYALAYFDSVYMLTRLTDPERTALNTALDPEYETFETLPFQPPTR